MQIFHFDPSGRFVSEGTADKSPLEPGVFHLPANACTVAPPALGPGFVAVWNGAAWTIQADSTPAVIEDNEPTPGELRTADIIGRLAEIDAASARPLREIVGALAAGLPAPEFALAKVSALETEAGELRRELAAL